MKKRKIKSQMWIPLTREMVANLVTKETCFQNELERRSDKFIVRTFEANYIQSLHVYRGKNYKNGIHFRLTACKEK